MDKGQDHKRQIQSSSSSSSSQAPQGRSKVPRQPLGWQSFLGHQLTGPLSGGLRVRVNKQFLVSK